MKKRIIAVFAVVCMIISINAEVINAEQNKKSDGNSIVAQIRVNEKNAVELSDKNAETFFDIGDSIVEIALKDVYAIDSISIKTNNEKAIQFTAESSLDKTEWITAGNYEHSNIIADVFTLNSDCEAKYLRIKILTGNVLCSEIEVHKAEAVEFPSYEDIGPKLYTPRFLDTVGSRYEQECEFLAYLGIIDGEQDGFYNGEANLTRAQFAKLAVNTLNLDVFHAEEQVFHDVDLSDALSDYVYTAYINGLISGFGDGTYQPDEKVLCQEAYTVICRMMNYDKTVDPNISYPLNYIYALQNEVSLKKIESKYTEPISRGDVALLIFNALHSRPYSMQGSKGNTIRYQKDVETLLEATRNICQKHGVLEAANQYSIYYVPENMNDVKDTVVISGNKYIYDSERLTPDYFIGTEVEYYIDNSNDDELCAFMLHSKNNPNILTYDVEEDIAEVSSDYITTDENNNKKIRISHDAMLMYNGISYGIYRNSFDVIANNLYGFIKLIDSDNDNVYDVVQYNDYVNEEVKLVDADKGIIQTESFRIDLNDSNVACTLFLNNSKIDMAQIEKGDVLSVSKSKNTEGLVCYDIHVGKEKISNIIINSCDEKTITINTDEKVYSLASKYASPNAKQNLDIGKNVELILDGFGKVHQIQLLNAEGFWNYAYLIYVYEKRMDEGMIRAVGLDAQVKDVPYQYPLQIDNGILKSKYKTLSDVRERIMNDNNGELEQLIRYRTNSKGVIKEIETASPIRDTSRLSLDYKSSAAKYKWAVGEWDYVYKVDNNTKYLIVPDDVKDYEKYRTEPILNGDDAYNIKIYDTNDDRTAAVIVMYGEKGAYFSESDRNLFLVTETSTGLDENNEPVKILKGYKQGETISFSEPYENAFDGIAVGDTMYVVLDRDGNVFRFRQITPDDPEISLNDETCNRFTTVEDINYTEIKDSWRWYDIGNVKIYIVDKKRKRIIDGSIGDIEINDEVLISIRAFRPNLVVVYKDI